MILMECVKRAPCRRGGIPAGRAAQRPWFLGNWTAAAELTRLQLAIETRNMVGGLGGICWLSQGGRSFISVSLDRFARFIVHSRRESAFYPPPMRRPRRLQAARKAFDRWQEPLSVITGSTRMPSLA